MQMAHTTIDWQEVWINLHNSLALETTKSAILEQIHLYDYNTFSYNKWHDANQICPLCLTLPESEFHLIFDCLATKEAWEEIRPLLERLNAKPVTKDEMAFGMNGSTAKILLRNWITLLLRECVIEQERIAYNNQLGLHNIREIKSKFNIRVKEQVLESYKYHKYKNILDTFEMKYCADGTFLEYDANIQHYTLPMIFPTT